MVDARNQHQPKFVAFVIGSALLDWEGTPSLVRLMNLLAAALPSQRFIEETTPVPVLMTMAGKNVFYSQEMQPTPLVKLAGA